MTRQTFTANDLTYVVSMDTELPPGLRTWALIEMRVIDEMTAQPPRGTIRIDSPFSGISPRVSSGGLLGFAGIPARAFPGLKANDYTVPITIRADGYLPLSRDVNVQKVPAFPNAFAPTDLGTLQLHRLPTVIYGRVALNTGTVLQGIAGATVDMTGLWKTAPPANLNVPADPPDLISVVPDLYFNRAQAGSQIQGLAFQGVPGPDKHLLQDAAAGLPTLRLSDRVQIAIGDVLAIDINDAARTEYVTIQLLTGGGTNDQPATITLDAPLRFLHRRGSIVHKVGFQNAGAATPLKENASAGDVCVFVNGINNLAAAPLISIQGGGAAVEYHAANYFHAVTNGDGFFRLPPLSRVAQCKLRAHDGAHPDIDLEFAPDYSDQATRVDFVYV